MPGRGPQTFKKRQKEQERKERQQEKMAKRLQRKNEEPSGTPDDNIEWPDADASAAELSERDAKIAEALVSNVGRVLSDH